MKPQQYYTLLYDMALATSGEIQLKPLLVKTLQRLLYHTGFPCGLFVRVVDDASKEADGIRCQIEVSICHDEKLTSHDHISLPLCLLNDGISLIDIREILDTTNGYQTALRIPIRGDGCFLLLGLEAPEIELPYRQLFEPIMNNFSKNLKVCRSNEAKTQTLENEIQDHKKTLCALKKSEDNLKKAQHIAKIGSWELNLETNELNWSDEIYRIFEILPQDFHLSYDNFLSSIHPDDREKVDKAYQDSVKNQTQYNIIHRVQFDDGRTKYISERGETFYDDADTPLYSIGTAQDVTTQHQAEQILRAQEHELRKAHDELETRVEERTKELTEEVFERKKAEQKAYDANQAKSIFLANISHELRTPMHGILSFSKIGKKKIDTASKEKLLEYYSHIETSGQRLLSLLNDLLDITKLESGHTELEFRTHSIDKIIDQAITEFRMLAKDKQLKLIIKTPEEDIKANIDGGKIFQVISNLLSNAIKFTPNGKSITISHEKTQLSEQNNKPAIRFFISDQGIGIPEAELNSVFNKFVQSSKTSTGAGGTGLGLAICKEIIETHKGSISAAHNPSGGTIFSFIIPQN